VWYLLRGAISGGNDMQSAVADRKARSHGNLHCVEA